MKLLGNYELLTREEVANLKKEAYDNGFKWGQLSSKKKIEELEASVKKKNRELEQSKEDLQDLKQDNKRQVEKLQAVVKVYEDERDDVAETVKQSIDNADLKAVLDARKEAYDKRDAKLKDREAKLGSDEEGEYKRGYADGVSDGVRKISEITQQDRDSAMKIAMVAASSHTPIDNLKELNNVHRLTAGTEDKEEE